MMSRSYKHTPIIKDGSSAKRKSSKREASKKVRKYKGFIPDGNYYKKIYNSWEIYDYISLCTFSDWCKIKEKNTHKSWNKEKNKEELYDEWARYFLRK